MADAAAASTLQILHNGQIYRSDMETAELLRQVQHWQAGGDRALEAALLSHGLKTGRIQQGPVQREQAEAAHRQPLTIDGPNHVEPPSLEGRVAYFARSDRRVYYVPEEMAKQFGDELWSIDFADLFETKQREWKAFEVTEAARLASAAQQGTAVRMPDTYGPADVKAEERRRTAATATIHVEYEGQQYLATSDGASSIDSVIHTYNPSEDGGMSRERWIPVVIRDALASGDLVDQQKRTLDGFTGLRIDGEAATPYQRMAEYRARDAARQTAQVPTAPTPQPSGPETVVADDSWLARTKARVERAFAWAPPPAPYRAGQTITYRDRGGQAHAATITRVVPRRDIDFVGWQYSFRVSVQDAASKTGERALTPREVKTALVMRSATTAHTPRDAPAQTLPTRQAADPPQRQPGAAWNTTVQQAWPGTTVRDRASGEQRATIAWPVNQPRPLAFRATQARGLEQGQE